MRWRTRCKPRGLSLIELLAATAIIGLMLAGVVQVRSEAIRRTADARAAAEALERLDVLLTQWEAGGWPESVIAGASGELGPRLRWRIDEIDRQRPETPSHDWLRVARVAAFRASAGADDPPLARLWVFLPPPADDTTRASDAR
ncbi:MAG: prepilin-type N-terminal cleavage/methylation domain-containing protein [Planctomycetota bacterium]